LGGLSLPRSVRIQIKLVQLVFNTDQFAVRKSLRILVAPIIAKPKQADQDVEMAEAQQTQPQPPLNLDERTVAPYYFLAFAGHPKSLYYASNKQLHLITYKVRPLDELLIQSFNFSLF